MKKHVDSLKIFQNILIFVGAIIILFICLHNLQYQNMITIIDDEFGYWGMGAQMAGKDWTGLLSTSAYYSYGYGILIFPLFKLGISSAMIFKIAIFYNAIFLLGSYFLTYYVANKWFVNNKWYFNYFISLAVTLYSNNLVQVNIAWSETLLYFLFWLLVVILMRLIEKMTVMNVIAVALISNYMYMVHNRAIVIVLSVMIIVVLKFLNSKEKRYDLKYLLLFLLILSISFLCIQEIKDYILTEWYLNGSGVLQDTVKGKLEINDYAGQVKKIKGIFSIKGIIYFLLSIAGKLYYQGLATCLLSLFTSIIILGGIIQKLYSKFKNKIKLELISKEYILLFCLIVFMGAVIVAAIFKFRPIGDQNYNNIIMGRYTDYVIGPLLLYGMGILPQIKKYNKQFIVTGISMIICALAVFLQFKRAASPYMILLNASGIFRLIEKMEDNFSYSFFIVLFVVLVISVIVFLNNILFKNNIREIIHIMSIVMIMLFWCYMAITPASNLVEGKDIKNNMYIKNVDEYTSRIDINIPIYYAAEDSDTVYNCLKILQFLQPDRKILVFDVSEIDKYADMNNIIIMSGNDEEANKLIGSRLKLIMDSGRLCIWESK